MVSRSARREHRRRRRRGDLGRTAIAVANRPGQARMSRRQASWVARRAWPRESDGARRDDCSSGRRTPGFTAMQFNAVVDTNIAAIALWESLGFETIGIVPEAFDSRRHGLVGLRVMYRRL